MNTDIIQHHIRVATKAADGRPPHHVLLNTWDYEAYVRSLMPDTCRHLGSVAHIAVHHPDSTDHRIHVHHSWMQPPNSMSFTTSPDPNALYEHLKAANEEAKDPKDAA